MDDSRYQGVVTVGGIAGAAAVFLFLLRIGTAMMFVVAWSCAHKVDGMEPCGGHVVPLTLAAILGASALVYFPVRWVVNRGVAMVRARRGGY